MYLCKMVEKKVLQSEIIDFFPTNAKRVVILDIKIPRQRKTIEKIFSPEKKPIKRKPRDKRQKQQALIEPGSNTNKKGKNKQKNETNKTNQDIPKTKQMNLLEILNSKNLR